MNINNIIDDYSFGITSENLNLCPLLWSREKFVGAGAAPKADGSETMLPSPTCAKPGTRYEEVPGRVSLLRCCHLTAFRHLETAEKACV